MHPMLAILLGLTYKQSLPIVSRVCCPNDDTRFGPRFEPRFGKSGRIMVANCRMMDYYYPLLKFLSGEAVVRKPSILAILIALSLALPTGRVAFCADTLRAPLRETMRLNEHGQLQKAADSNDEQYLLRVAEIKKLVDAGKPFKVEKAAKKLKKDFPNVAGEDFNSFMEAEVQLAWGNLTKAVKQYDEFLDKYATSPLKDAALNRQFEVATEFLAGRKKTILLVFRVSAFDDGVKIMEKISDRTGTADIAKNALLAVAKSYEKRKEYNEAYLKWSEISMRWPTGEVARDALLAMARTKYAAYRGAVYDGSSLISAKTYYENFKLRYPEEAKKIQVDDILTRIGEELAEKNLLIAKYYDRTGSAEPANMYYQMVVDSWPNTKAAQTAKQKLSNKN
jgi:outer membrane protein assembly factor BamD (BamD/ComL family)